MSENRRRLYTSESVTEGHPDKVADQISDAVLDAILAEDPFARVACETLVTTGLVFVTGEITTACYVDIPRVVRETVKQIGYDRRENGFDGDTCAVLTAIDEQSPDIARGVVGIGNGPEHGLDTIGAGDQGIVYGYACNETPEYMPLPIATAHRLARRLAECRREAIIPELRPDGKAQCTFEYEGALRPVRLDSVVVSAQHAETADFDRLKDRIRTEVIDAVIPEHYVDENTRYFINPTGRFVLGGPQADAGLTGRKIIVDTYGGRAHSGGGCFSGKDGTKVDRSASYMARYAAKHVVAAGWADECELEVAYAIGVAAPVSLRVDTFGSSRIPEEEIERLLLEHFDFRPAAIIRDLDLRRPIFLATAAYGHFGRTDHQFPWERLDRLELLQAAAAMA